MEIVGSHKWKREILNFNIKEIIIKILSKLIKNKLFIIIE